MRRTSQNGITLVELLVVMTVMSFVASAAAAVLLSAMSQGRGLEQKCDSIDAVRNALEKFGRSVRMGRNVGDVYGDLNLLSGVVYGTPVFPGSNDALYGNGAAPPPGGWPVWADGSQPTSFSMQAPPGDGLTNGNNCFVCQVPIFDSNGFPTGVPAGYVSSGSSVQPNPNTTETAVQTHVYRILPDPNNSGEYLMQTCVIPGYGEQPSALSTPVTLVKHIIGPVNPATGGVRAFQYIDRTNPTAAPVDGIPLGGTPPVANFSGVVLNLEICPHDISAAQKDRKPLALKTEVYLRNNSLANSQGLPSSVSN